MYDGKVTRYGKPVQRTVRFGRNVNVFAGRLSRMAGQLMLTDAIGFKRAFSAILSL
jgi:hypothetical protein